MKVIVGLGNQGEKYKNNRHNVGFVVVDRLVEELRVGGHGLKEEWEKSTKGRLQYIWFEVKGEKIEIIKPLTFMNNSGYSVAYAYKKHSLSPSGLYVIHDDLDIPVGGYKIQKGKGPRLHRGIASVEGELGIDDFWRVRVGVENRPPDDRVSGEAYVLQDFSQEEFGVLTHVINKIVRELKLRILSF